MSDLVPTEDSPLALLTAAVFPWSLKLCLIYTDLEREIRGEGKREKWRQGGEKERKRDGETEEKETLRGREVFDSV